VSGKLKNAGILPEWISENTPALPNGSKIESIIKLDNEAVVQDVSSQRVQELMQIPLRQKPHGSQATDIKKVWDCCAASGGKSIMALDINNSIQLSVSDKRSSALDICRQRFKKAGITSYHDFIADLTQKKFVFPGYPGVNDTADVKVDLVIADVPCTGSGTWSRTPEQLFYFNPSEIKRYSTLQRQILRNVIPAIKSGGYLLYITCSVFKEENEEIVDYVVQEFSLKSNSMELLEGYRTRADTLFAALFSIA
jgi:16S rRNA (cytosine967-C5)-methyltransferase